MRQEIIEHALGEGMAEGADSGAVAAAAVRSFKAVLAEVSPLVGVFATRALYVRSLHLARSSFRRPEADSEMTTELASLQNDLASRAPAEAKQAGQALLHAFADLLVSLIGMPLTHRMLRTAWGITADALPPEEKTK